MLKKSIRRILAAGLILIFILSPLKFDKFRIGNFEALGMEVVEISRDTTWPTGEHIIRDRIVIANGATLTIEKGAVIKFTKGEDYFYSPGLSVSDGRIVAEGTREEKIIFTTESGNNSYETGEYSINLYNNNPGNKESFFRYVVLENGGYVPQMIFNNNFLNTAFAQGGVSAFNFGSGRIHIENSEFKNNPHGAVSVFAYNPEDYFETANSNFENNGGLAVNSGAFCLKEDEEAGECENWNVHLKNNWYGDSEGPYRQGANENTDGEAVEGDANLDGWRANNLIADPVIIVPGIMGSEKVNGELKLDPILHTYDNLIDSMEKNGYEKDKNLFEFPYNWRDNNETTANYLQSKIEGVINTTGVSKVDLAAHSMGGLAARAYIEETADGTRYNDTVDQLITIGTPHRGSPKAYLRWEAGDGFFGWQEKLAEHHFKNEAEHGGYENIFAYIHDKVTSVRDLLPDYDYLSENGSLRNYSENYPRNIFLEELNQSENLEKLKSINFTNIIGKLDGDESTIAEIRVTNSSEGGLWEHGMPENFYDGSTDQGLEYGEGDETVPVISSDSIDFAREIEIDSTHGDLPTEAQCQILKELADISENDCQKVDNWHIPNLLLFNVFSPIDIQIVEIETGRRVGKNFSTGEIINEISGAYYTGFDTDSEFVTIPNPEDGEYKILTQGTGDGEYRVEVASLRENPQTGEIAETAKIFKGIASEGSSEEKTVEIKDGAVKTDVKLEEDQTSPEAKIYFNTQTNSIAVEGIDENPTAVAYSIISAFKKNQKQKDKTIVATITDQAGNATVLTYVEKFPNRERRAVIELKSVSYNGVAVDLNNTTLKYKWNNNKKDGAYKMFASHIRATSKILESHYRPKKDITIIMTKPQELNDSDEDDDCDKRPVREKLSGMVVPGLVTNQGNVNVNY